MYVSVCVCVCKDALCWSRAYFCVPGMLCVDAMCVRVCVCEVMHS